MAGVRPECLIWAATKLKFNGLGVNGHFGTPSLRALQSAAPTDVDTQCVTHCRRKNAHRRTSMHIVTEVETMNPHEGQCQHAQDQHYIVLGAIFPS